MVTKNFKCAGRTYVVNGRTSIIQAKKELKKEAKESIEYLKDVQKDVGLTTKQKQKMVELRRIIRSC